MALVVLVASSSAYSYMSVKDKLSVSDALTAPVDKKASYALGYALGDVVGRVIKESEKKHDYKVRREELLNGIRDRLADDSKK